MAKQHKGASEHSGDSRIQKRVVLYFELQLASILKAIAAGDQSGEIVDHEATQRSVEAFAHDIFLPVSAVLERHTQSANTARFALAVSGHALELFAKYAPEVLDSLRRLNDTGAVEWLALPYNNSLSAMVSDEVYREEVTHHTDALYTQFAVKPKTLLAAPFFVSSMKQLASGMGFESLLVKEDLTLEEGKSGSLIVGDQSNGIVVMGTDMHATGAVMHRFGAGDATLSVKEWIAIINRASSDTVVVGFPYEIFRTHRDAGVLRFMETFLDAASTQGKLVSVTDVVQEWQAAHAEQVEDHPIKISVNTDWWLGTDMQRDALSAIAALDKPTSNLLDNHERRLWLQLLAAEYFANMSSNAGLSNAYLSPYDAFEHYNEALQALSRRASSMPAVADDAAAKAVEAERQHPTTPAWAVHEQSRYTQVTHTHI